MAKKVVKKELSQKSTSVDQPKSQKKPVVNSTRIQIGDKVPEVTVPCTGQKKWSIEEHKGFNVVLYFYPKDATPGCTVEGQDFSRLLPQFKKKKTMVFGVSRDSLKSHDKFIEKQNYKMDLISDEDEKLCELFGVIKMKNMYGKQVRGIERSTFVLNQKGELILEWRGVKVAGHAEAVLKAISSLESKE